MGWGDQPGATTEELVHALAKFDPQGLAQALGRDEDHTAWFAQVCDALLPGYMYSLDMAREPGAPLTEMPPVPVVPVRANLKPYSGPEITWPPGWSGLWSKPHVPPPAVQLVSTVGSDPLVDMGSARGKQRVCRIAVPPQG
jgi:hypothetical protein